MAKKKAEKEKSIPAGWSVIKSGVRVNGDWYANDQYVKGWYFYNKSHSIVLGPFKTFEEGLPLWEKQKK